MIRIVMTAAAAALLASACNAAAGGKGALVAECVEGGEEKKTCECVANELEKNADKDAFRAMTLEAQGKTEEAEKIISALPMDKQISVATAAMGAMMKCSPGLSTN
jgi:hypothetical protein